MRGKAPFTAPNRPARAFVTRRVRRGPEIWQYIHITCMLVHHASALDDSLVKRIDIIDRIHLSMGHEVSANLLTIDIFLRLDRGCISGTKKNPYTYNRTASDLP